MKTMRLPTINPQSQQQPGRLPQILSTSGSTCKAAFGGASSNLTYEQPYLPAFCSKPVSTTSICSVSGKQSPSLLGLYRSTMNQFRVQQYAFVASLANKSSNAREQMLKRQLMKAVMKHQPGLDYLDFLRKYAEDATSSNSTIRQEFDYLDYIRRDAAEEFRRNGVEVTNFEGFRITDGGRSLGIAQVGDSNLLTATSTKDSYGKGGRESTMKHVDDSAIISYGDFTTTSMSNHEPQESSFETYNASPKKSEIDFSAKKSEIDFAASQVNGASRNRRNIFRNSHSHRRRRSSSRKRQESSERPRSRPGKNVPPAAASTTGRRPRRSKPYDGASQRGGRPAAASNPNEKQESYVSYRTTNPSTPDHSSKIPRSTTR